MAPVCQHTGLGVEKEETEYLQRIAQGPRMAARPRLEPRSLVFLPRAHLSRHVILSQQRE